MLDVACGTGVLSLAMAMASIMGPAGSVLGIDVSAGMVAWAEKRACPNGVSTARIARMDAEAPALPGASFDLVVCALGLMYVPDVDAALREVCRVRRPSGRTVFSPCGANTCAVAGLRCLASSIPRCSARSARYSSDWVKAITSRAPAGVPALR